MTIATKAPPDERPVAPVGPNPGDPQCGTGRHLVDSEQLLRGNKSVDILHKGVIYRLQATRLGKLILTK